MAKRIYAKHKPFFRGKEQKQYNVINMYAEILEEEENPWMIFASKFINAEQRVSFPIKDITKIKTEEFINVIEDYNDKVIFLKYLIRMKDFNPLTDYVPLDKLGPHWSKLLDNLYAKANERKQLVEKMNENRQRLFLGNKIGELYIVEDLNVGNAPFEEKRYLDFFVIYDKKRQFFMIKTTPLDYNRLDLTEVNNKLEEIFPNRFFKHGGNFFIKNQKGILLSQKQFDKILKSDIFTFQ